MKKYTGRLLTILIAGMALICLSACYREEIKEGSDEAKPYSLTEIKIGSEEPEYEKGILTGNGIKGKNILEDEEYIYAVGERQICKISKADNESIILWDNWKKGEEKYNIYSVGSGILLNNKIYFYEDSGDEYGVSVIGIDGTVYQKLLTENTYGHSLFFDDNILYTYWVGNYSGGGYCLKEDGSLDVYEKSFPYHITMDVGSCTAEECKYHSNLYNVYNYPEGFNNNYVLFSWHNCNGKERTLYLIDLETMESSIFMARVKDIEVIDMDDEYVYITREDEERNEIIVERISLNGREWSELFRESTLNNVLGERWKINNALTPVIREGKIYYSAVKDYQTFIICGSLAKAQETVVVGDCFYDRGVKNIGKMEEICKTVYGEKYKDTVFYSKEISYLVVDDRFEGADEINRVIYNEEWADFSNEKEELENSESIQEEYGQYNPWIYTSSASPIYYFDGNYFSFYQSSSIFTGGAHGRSTIEGYTFNLHTGDELALSDIIENSQRELKEIVTRYFAEYIDKCPVEIFDNALEDIYRATNFKTDYYLTDYGIRFYVEPYAISGYSYHEVTIPYSEFKMKINLQLLTQ